MLRPGRPVSTGGIRTPGIAGYIGARAVPVSSPPSPVISVAGPDVVVSTSGLPGLTVRPLILRRQAAPVKPRRGLVLTARGQGWPYSHAVKQNARPTGTLDLTLTLP